MSGVAIHQPDVPGFPSFEWSDFAGEHGAYVAQSADGSKEAILAPNGAGWHCWIVRRADGATLDYKEYTPCT